MKNQVIKSASSIMNLVLVLALFYAASQISTMSGLDIGIQRALIEAQQ
jgi:hypothetical protein